MHGKIATGRNFDGEPYFSFLSLFSNIRKFFEDFKLWKYSSYIRKRFKPFCQSVISKMVQILTDLFSFSELWIWLLRYFVLIDYQERIFEKERKEIMASKEVSPHISFSFDFTIASWQLTWPHCHISLRFKSIAVEFWFVECFFVDSYDDHLSRECLSEVGELEKQFSRK